MNEQRPTSVALGLKRPLSTAGAALLLTLSLAASACGQKGPLTLPKSATPAAAAAASASTR